MERGVKLWKTGEADFSPGAILFWWERSGKWREDQDLQVLKILCWSKEKVWVKIKGQKFCPES